MPATGRFAPKAAVGKLENQLPLYPRKQTNLNIGNVRKVPGPGSCTATSDADGLGLSHE